MASDDEDNSFYNLEVSDLTIFISGSVQTNNSIDTNESENLKNQIETQEEHEFIRLEQGENKIILAEGKAFSSQLERYKKILPTTTTRRNTVTGTSSLNDNVFVISFLGDTSSGKSFLADHLPGVQSFVFDENEHLGSTTANVTCFESNDILDIKEKNNCLVLDFEGENGSRFPRLLRRMLDQVFSSEGARERREAVASYFPTLAYLLSNVIILMGQDDLFSNSRYIDRVKKFAAQAVGTVQQNRYKPLLILVQNKYAGEHVLSPTATTRKFYETNLDVKDLELFFSHVRCIILPFKHTKSTLNINKTFDEQVVALRKLLTLTCQERQNRLLPHFAWLLLTQKVIKNLSEGKTVMVHLLLEDIFMKKKGENEDAIILFLFRRLYEKENISSTRRFHYCRQFAMEVLARCTALRFPLYPYEKVNELIEKECKGRLKKLWELLDEYRPCEALYMGKGYVKNRNRPVFCYQHKAVHESMHQTSEVVHGASWFRLVLEKLGIQLLTIDKWIGPFESNDVTSDNPGDDMHKRLLETTNEYFNALKNNPSGIYTTFNNMLQKWNIDIKSEQLCNWNTCFCCFGSITNNTQTEYNQNSIICSTCHEELPKHQQDSRVETVVPSPSSIRENECDICMSSPREVMFVPCNHYHYCRPCANKIRDQFKICSLCKQTVKGIQNVY